MISAATVTTSKFGPSGSSNNANNVLEETIAVKPKVISEICFDLKYMYVYYRLRAVKEGVGVLIL